MTEITLADLAGRIGGRVVGDGTFAVKGISSLTGAGPGEITFFGDPRLADRLAECKAGALISPPGLEGFAGPRIESANPYLAFALALAWFHPRPEILENSIHETAVVAPDAVLEGPVALGPHVVVEAGSRIGPGTLIEAGSVIGAESQVGSGCWLHPRVVLYHHTVVGNRVEIHSGAVIGSDGFGYAKDGPRYVKFPQVGRTVLGDDVEIGANVTIDRGAVGDTVLAEGVKLDNQCHLAHNVRLGEHTACAAQVGISGSTSLGARCMVGGQSGFAGHATIGDDVEIAAKAGMRGEVASGTRWFGAPAMPYKEGLRNTRAFARLHDMLRRLRALEERLEKE